VGLGDRHGENILLEASTGACVHVDFDCLFDKGLNLQKPEVVPFRLTQHMISGMGPTGYDGVFRSVMEVTMRVLREEEAMLIAVLEPFLNDPTLGWAKSQRADSSDAESHRRGKANKDFDARAVINTTRGRLRGVYNLRQSHAWDHHGRHTNAPPPPSGLTDSHLELSVQGQVHRLIQEATSDENLAQMYNGWMAWL